MDNKSKKIELDQARRSVRSLDEKELRLNNSGGNLDSNGEPPLAGGGFERDQAQLARTNISGGPQLFGTISLGLPGGDEHITGRGSSVNPVSRVRTEREPKKKYDKKEAIIRPTKLSIPIVRPLRPENKDGATSFHFSHESVSKTNYETVSENGFVNRKGSAKDHVSYIEREEALAKIKNENDLNNKTTREALLELIKKDPKLAKTLNINEKTTDDEFKKISEGSAATKYIEREEALAHNTNGSPVLFSNISDDPKERADFWKLVEQHERNPSGDIFKLNIGDEKEFWDKIKNDEETPSELKKALEYADPNKEIRIKIKNNDDIRIIMKKYGWHPTKRANSQETDEEKIERQKNNLINDKGAVFEDGRGGRVQFRIVGELPYDVSQEARVRILKYFSKEFEKRNLPYIAVMHAPDHTNDARNWHFHLVYHDRPVKKFTGLKKDHYKKIDKNASKYAKDKNKILLEALKNFDKSKIDQWDFTVEYTKIKTVSGNKIKSYPFEQNKDRNVVAINFIPKLRKILANLTNTELEKANLKRRLDHRRYDEMGIHKKTEKHLGTKSARLENLGVPTEVGQENEMKQWEYIQQKIKENSEKEERDINFKLNKWKAAIKASDLSDAEIKKIEKSLILWEQSKRLALEHIAIVQLITQKIERMESRAQKMKLTAIRHLDAIKLKKANSRQISHESLYNAKLKEANNHIAGLHIYIADEFLQKTTSNNIVQRENKIANDNAKIIMSLIDKGKENRKIRENISINDNQPTIKASNDNKIDPKKHIVKNSVFNAFIDTIIKSNRRLIKVDNYIIPVKPTEKELYIINAVNYTSTQSRLKKIKTTQDNLLTDLTNLLNRNPGALKAKNNVDVANDNLPANERYTLQNKNKRLQIAFKQFGNDPVIIKLIKDKVANSKLGNDKINQNKNDVKISNDNKENILASKIITLMDKNFIRGDVSSKDNILNIRFKKDIADNYKIPENVNIKSESLQNRIEALNKRNNRSLNRIISYVNKAPFNVIQNSDKNYSLKNNAPKELKIISDQFSNDNELKKAMENAVIKNRLDKLKSENIKKPVQTDLFDEPKNIKTNIKDNVKEVSMGARKVIEDEEFDKEAAKNAQAAKNNRKVASRKILDEAALDKINVAKAKSKNIILADGLHDKIDAWIKADRLGLTKDRVSLSIEIKNNKELKAIVDNLENKSKARFQRDWEKFDAENDRKNNVEINKNKQI